MAPTLTLVATVLDAPDARELADFYRRLLDWKTDQDEPDWVKLSAPDGSASLSFQGEPYFSPPVWPTNGTHQQMMSHLDFRVDDLTAATDHAIACGASLAEFQPQDDVRVMLDPVGHPFCLFI